MDDLNLPLGEYVEAGLPPEEKERRRRKDVLEAVGGAIIAALIIILIVVVVLGQTRAVKRGQTISFVACALSLQADVLAAAGDALAAPPAPAPARLIAVQEIQKATERLHHLEKACPAGASIPKPAPSTSTGG